MIPTPTETPSRLQSQPIPFVRALAFHAPQDLWTAYVAAQDRTSRVGKRPHYLAMGVREWQDKAAAFEARRTGAHASERLAFERVYAAFIERLVAGELTGLVQDDPPFGPWRPIPPHGWRSMQVIDVEAGSFRAGGAVLQAVQIVEGRYEPATEITGSGSPGRTTSKHLFMAEHRRRCEAGIAMAAVKAEAAHLEAWMRKHHPGAPGATAKTIENNIRDEHRAWTARRQGAAEKVDAKVGTVRP
jgi:hypothetical protein